MVTSGADRTARLWDVATCLPLRTLDVGDAPVWGVSLAPDGRTALSAQEDGTVALWDIGSGSLLRTLGKHDDVATAVAFSPDDSRQRPAPSLASFTRTPMRGRTS